jgi:hypothetical protein
MSVEESLQRVLEHSLQQLCEIIEQGECSLTIHHTQARLSFVRIINSLPVCCRSLHDQAQLHDGFQPILFYERVRVGLVDTHYFLGGVPSGLQLFTGQISVDVPDDEARKLTFKEIIADRMHVVAKLETMKSTQLHRIALIENYHPSDLSVNVPGPVRVFVARCRAMCRTIHRLKREKLFRQCSNHNCNRLFYTGEVGEMWRNAAERPFNVPSTDATTEPSSHSQDEYNSARYWELAGGPMHKGTLDLSEMRFCCDTCSKEHATHLQSLLQDMGIDLDADDAVTRTGRARVGYAFQLALRRNEVAARSLRIVKNVKRTYMAVSPEEIEHRRNQIITALNVDIGMLYASKLLAECANLSKGKVLPGANGLLELRKCRIKSPLITLAYPREQELSSTGEMTPHTTPKHYLKL